MKQRNLTRHSIAILNMILAFLLWQGMANAQTNDALVVEGNQETDIQKLESATVEIITRPKQNIQLQNGVPVNLEMSLENVPGGTNDLAAGVTVKAYGRFVEVEEQKVGQLMLLGVQKGDKLEALDETKFSSQFVFTKPEFNTLNPISIQGNQEALIAALKKIQTEQSTEDEDAAKKEDAPSNSTNAASGGSSANEEAANYKQPEPLKKIAQPKVSSRTTSEGCTTRVDLKQNVAILQTRVEILEDSKIKDRGKCSDTNTRYPIEKSYAFCKDTVDLKTRKATAQYQAYYVDAALKRTNIGKCVEDKEKQFDIVEDATKCTIQFDFTKKTATPYAELIYSDNNNKRNIARPCMPSEVKKAVPLLQTKSGCSIRHDFAANKSYSQSIWQYTLGGISYNASGCRDDGTVYPIQTGYKNNVGQNLCAPIISLKNSTVTLQSRKYITVNNLNTFITECTPDTTSKAVIKTTDGCRNPSEWTHDIAAKQSYESERYYYLENNQQVKVTGCQKSTKTYAHQFPTTGWRTNDEGQYAYRLVSIVIKPDNLAPYTIQTNYLAPGSPKIPYVLKETKVIPTGKVTYNGCSATREQNNVKIWTRPDKTEYNQVIGTADPVGPVFACTITAAPYWKLQNSSSSYSRAVYNATCSYNDHQGTARSRTQKSRGRLRTTATYKGYRSVSREDGTHFLQTSKATYTVNYDTGAAGRCMSYGHWSDNGGGYTYPTATSVLYNQSSWDKAEGW